MPSLLVRARFDEVIDRAHQPDPAAELEGWALLAEDTTAEAVADREQLEDHGLLHSVCVAHALILRQALPRHIEVTPNPAPQRIGPE